MAFRKDKAIEAAEKYAARGQFEKAAREYEAIVAADPKDLRSWLLLADALGRAGKNNEAIEAYVRVGQAYVTSGDVQKALAVFRQVLALDASRVDVQLRCATLLQDAGRIPDAIAMYEAVGAVYAKQGQIAQVHEICQTIARLDPSNVKNLLRMAELFSREQKIDDSIAQFRMAADLLRERGLVDEYVRVAERLLFHRLEKDVAYELTRIYLQQGQPQNAMRKLNTLLQQSQSDVVALELLAQTMQGLGKTDKAVSVVLELVKELLKQGQGAALARAQRDALRVLDLALTWQPGHPGLTEQAQKLRAGRPAPPLPRSMETAQVGAPEPVEDAEVAELDPSDSQIEEVEEVEELEELDDIDEIDTPDSAFDDVADVDPEARRPEPSNTMTKQVMSSLEERATLEPAVAGDGLDLDKILQEARVLVKYRLFDHALTHLRELLAADPNHELGLELEAEAHAAVGRIDEAAATRVRLARAIMERDQDRAAALLRGALELVPGHARALELSEALGGVGAGGGAEGSADDGDDFIDLEEPAAKKPAPAARARAMTPVAPPEQQALSARASLVAASTAERGAEVVHAAVVESSESEVAAAEVPSRLIDEQGSGTSFELDDGITTPEAPPAPETIADVGTDGDGLVLGLADPDLVGDLREQTAAGMAGAPGQGGVPDDLAMDMSGPVDEISGLSDLEAASRQGGEQGEDSHGDFSISLQEDRVATPAEPEPVEDRFGLDEDDVTSVIHVGPAAAEGEEPEEIEGLEMASDEADDAVDSAPVARAPVETVYEESAGHDVAPEASSAAATPVASAAPAAVEWPDLADELEELEFFLSQDLEDDARAAYDDLIARHPGHPDLLAIAVRLGIAVPQPEVAESRSASAEAQPSGDTVLETPSDDVEDAAEADAASSMDHELIGSIVADEAETDDSGADSESSDGAAAPLISFEDEDDDTDFLSSIFDDGATTKKKEVKHRAVANVSNADAATNYDLGTAYFGMGLVDDAIKAFSSAAADPVWRARAMIMLGTVKRQAGDVDGAVEAYEEAADSATSTDERSEASYELGATLEQRGDTKAALEAFEEVAEGFRDRDDRIAALKDA